MIVNKLIKTIISSTLCADHIMDSIYYLDMLGISLSTSIKNLFPVLSCVNVEMMYSIMNYLTLPLFFAAIISLISFVRSITPGSGFAILSNIYDLIKKLVECMVFYIPVIIPFLIFDILIWLYKIYNKRFESAYQKRGSESTVFSKGRC